MPMTIPAPVGTLAAQSGQAWPQSPSPYPGGDPAPGNGGMGSYWSNLIDSTNRYVQQYAPQQQPGINPYGGVGSNPYGPPVPQQPMAPRPAAVMPGQMSYGSAGQNIWNAQNAQLGAQYGLYGAQRAGLGAQSAVYASQRQGLGAAYGTLAAQGGVLGAQAGLRASTQAYLTERERALSMRKQEEQQLQSAQNNVGDQSAVGLEDLRRRSRNSNLSAIGVEAPSQVQAPLGQEGTATPVGTEVAAETQATRVGRRNVQQDALSALSVEQAQLNEARAQGTVSEAQAQQSQAELNQRYADLSTQAASITANEADLGARAAGINVSEAGTNLHSAQQPPVAGQVFDETTGTFVTPSQAAVNQANNTRVVWDPVNGRYVERAGTELSPSSNGLYQTRGGVIVNEQTGEPTDSRTGNIYRNGRWTDPQTGNYQDESGNWVDPATGNTYHVVNHQTGSGFWVNPQGMYMSGDGIWRDPVTGQAVYGVTGQTYSTRRTTGSGGYAPIQ